MIIFIDVKSLQLDIFLLNKYQNYNIGKDNILALETIYLNIINISIYKIIYLLYLINVL